MSKLLCSVIAASVAAVVVAQLFPEGADKIALAL